MSDYTNIIQEINTNIADNTDQSITALKVRTTLIDMIGAVDENVTEAIGDIVVPTKTSELTNDSGFITASALSGLATEQFVNEAVSAIDVPTKTSDLTNDSGFITATSLEPLVTKTELSNAGYVTASIVDGYVSEAQLASMSYVTESQLQQAAYATEAYVVEYVASHTGPIDLSAYVTKDELNEAGYVTASIVNGYVSMTQLTSMSYATEQYVQTAISGIDVPTKTSDLTNDSGFITSSALSGLATETYVTNAIADIVIPTKTSDLTNDSGFITSIPSEYITETELSAMSYVTTTDLATKQDTLVSGTNIKTINGETLLGEGDITIQAGSEDYSHVLTFTAEQANSSVSLTRQGSNTDLTNAVLEYSTDNGENWSDYTLGTSIALAAIGDSVMFKGTNTTLGISSSDYHQFVMTGSIKASGDITSLFNEVGGDFPMPTYGCCRMFQGCSALTQAPVLPSTTLGNYCYNQMFMDCSYLTTAPSLPATTLAEWCYASMFNSCSRLTQAPDLPATTLATYCYSGMFRNCTRLTQAPDLPATTLAIYCYLSMFRGCTSLTQAPELPAMNLTNYCYDSMFRECTSLVKAPDLPATNLLYYCYQAMFRECTSLAKAPDLPATTLAVSCYVQMFYGCTNLNYVKAMFTTTPSNSYTNGWLTNVSSTGTFIKSNDATWTTTGANAVPTGWTVYKAVSVDTDDLPESYVEDNSKVLQVVNGVWSKVNMTVPAIDESLIPNTTNTYTLGSSATQYAYTYSYGFIENGTNIKDIYTQTEVVTQAQYDALTEEQKNSETIYVISDQQAYMNNELVTESSLDSRGFLTAANFVYDTNTGTLTLVL